MFILCVVGFATAVPAQQIDNAGTGTVSGRVFCADTNGPARKASVVLVSADTAEALRAGENKHVEYGGETQLDGSFDIPNVPPGVYYVTASKAGYMSSLAPLYVSSTDESTVQPTGKKPVISAPRITVQANLSATGTVSIERGAAVSGSVIYDDGSPASGLDLELLVRSNDKWVPIPPIPGDRASHSGFTDDKGHYRIAGLPSGEYVLDAKLTISTNTFHTDAQGSVTASMSRTQVADIYSGGSTRRKHAVPFKLTAGEERPGEDIDIPLSKMHTVRGSLVAARDAHALNGGTVSLLYADDRSAAYNTKLWKDKEGFTLNYVLEGDYILRVDTASDVVYREVPVSGGVPLTRVESRVVRTYGSTEQPLHVSGEVSDIVISVPTQSVEKAGSTQRRNTSFSANCEVLPYQNSAETRVFPASCKIARKT